MPNRFARQMARAAASNMMRQHGESVVYYPRDGSDGRPIEAKVSRNALEIVQETGDIASQAMIITVENDNVRGISSDELDTGGDEISVSLRVGLTAKRRSIARVLGDHGAMLRLLVQ